MRLIESKTLTTTQAQIEFASIPSTFTDLVILMSLRDNGGVGQATYISFNGSTSDFSGRYLYGSGSSISSGVLARYVGSTRSDNTANTFNNTTIYIPNYTGSTNKSFSVDNVTENNATAADTNIIAGLWSNTAPITSFSITPAANSWVAGSIISLYGVLKGSDGIVTTSP